MAIMPPGWCSQHWMFSSQAIAAGMFVVVVCHEPPGRHSHTRIQWAQGSWVAVRTECACRVCIARHVFIPLCVLPGPMGHQEC